MENIDTGLLLMAVGMIAVFIILLIVINLGKLLIAVINKVAPEEVAVQKPVTTAQQTTAIDNNTMAAIKAAVNIVTNSKGKVLKVEKI